MNPAPTSCPSCGEPLPPESSQGLCPRCILRDVVEESPPPSNDISLDDVREIFPDWEILELLGVGGIGRVYKARDPRVDRIVALKILSPDRVEDPEWVERFTREARALARLNHPHIVQVHGFGATPQPHLVMEYVDGVNLRQAMKSGGLSARETIVIVPKLCDALHYAHEHGVLHRDIKPENILIDTEGRVKIVDFGLAKLCDEGAIPFTLTQSGAKLGTIAYMAPEQIENPSDVDHRADIYSLGVVLYEMLTGELPLGVFPSPSEANGSDPRLDSVVLRTLEKKKEKRFQDAETMGSEIETASSSKVPESKAQPTSSKALRRILISLLAIAIAIPIAFVITYFAAQSNAANEAAIAAKKAAQAHQEEAAKQQQLADAAEKRQQSYELARNWIEEASRTDDPEAKTKAVREILEGIESDDPELNYAAIRAFQALGEVKMDRSVFQEPLRRLVLNEALDWEIRSWAIGSLFFAGHEPKDVETVLAMVETIPTEWLYSISGALSTVCDKDFTGEYAAPMLRLLERGFEAEQKRAPNSTTMITNRSLLGALWGARVTPEIESLVIEWSYLDTSDRGFMNANSRAYYAFYSALSVFANKRTATVKRILELAESPDMNNIGGRCFWGMKSSVPDKEDQKLVAATVIRIFGHRNNDYMWRQGLDLLKAYASAEQVPALSELAAREELPEERKESLNAIIEKFSP